jgi:hypothetical protein
MYHDPPAWTYLISPAASLLAVALAYLLGNMQGRAQPHSPTLLRAWMLEPLSARWTMR